MKFGIALTIVALTVMLSCGHLGFGFLSGYAKMTASAGFLITALAAGAFSCRYGIIIFIGLIFSAFGDFFLIFSGQTFFLAGLISFFLAHVAYCIAYASYAWKPLRSAAALVIMSVPAVLLAMWLWPGIPAALKFPVIAYMVVISLMVALSIATWGRPAGTLIIVGAVMFYFSDIFVARGRFAERDIWNGLIGLPLYFGGQLFLAASIWPARASESEQIDTVNRAASAS
jgi:uncharacterized membrane protein YhhN